MTLFYKLGLLILAVSGSSAHVLDNVLSEADGGTLSDGGKIWVLLVAGSTGWYNYRHQADICHAYQVVHNHGIPDENIIVMMKDDIAVNVNNPKNGTIINRPDGPNVYLGVPKDYNGNENNQTNFLRILNGTDMTGRGSGKTINSGPNDHVFVYFADHGAPGMVCFEWGFLKATELNNQIRNMHAAKKFKNLVFYIEACESGSMFANLLKPTLDTFATTAANGQQSSYACNWDEKMQVFLGDVYSVKWMEDSDKENLNKETLEKQYRLVKHETNTSNVCQFGDFKLAKMPVAEFQGLKNPKHVPSPVNYYDTCLNETVPGFEVTKISLERKLLAAETKEDAYEMLAELKLLQEERTFIEKTARNIIAKTVMKDLGDIGRSFFTKTPELTQHGCYYELAEAFHTHCFNLGQHEWALRQMLGFVNLCEGGFDVKRGVKAILEECGPHKMPRIEIVD